MDSYNAEMLDPNQQNPYSSSPSPASSSVTSSRIASPAPQPPRSSSNLPSEQPRDLSTSIPSSTSGSPSINTSNRPQITLSESLSQLQGQAAFVTRPQHQAKPSKELPGPPQVDELGDELFIEGLNSPDLFVSPPTDDALSALLERYLPANQRPQRDLSGNYQGQTLDELISARNWRAVARFCHDTIIHSSPRNTAHIQQHWSLRFYALLRLQLLLPLSHELTRLQRLLPPSLLLPASFTSASTPDTTIHPEIPFSLYLYSAVLPGLMGNKSESVELLTSLIRASKTEYWGCKKVVNDEEAEVWKGRIEEMGLILTRFLSEIKNDRSATSLLEVSSPSNPATLRSLSRLHFSVGDLESLVRTTQTTAPMQSEREGRRSKALEFVGKGDWKSAEESLRALVEEDQEDFESMNNLAVVLLYAAKLDEAIELLHRLLASDPSLGYANETILFNFVTLSELRREDASAHKVRLLRIAAELGGQGLDPKCFKLAM